MMPDPPGAPARMLSTLVRVIGDRSVAAAPSVAVPSLAAGTRKLVPALVGTILVLPSLVWVSIDRSIWPWDPSWYGEVSIDLWATLRTEPSNWPGAMAHAFGAKPPAVAWLGQFFVPLGEILGRDQTALLLSVVLCQAVTIALVYAALARLAGAAPAVCGALLVAASPLFVSMSHEYFAEPIQTVAVAWLVLIVARAPQRRAALTLAQLPGALALAMLAKLSSPAYVAAPAAGALLLLWLHRTRPPEPGPAWRDSSVLASSLGSAALVLGAIGWYRVNLEAAIRHARNASADNGLYGVDRGFARQFPDWIERLRDASFLPRFWVVVAILAAVSLTLASARGLRISLRDPRIVVGAASLVSVVLVCAALASQPNNETRYLLPLVPLVAVTFALLVAAARSRPILVVALGVLVLEFAGTTLQSFGYARAGGFAADRVTSPVEDSSFAATLEDVVRRTCTEDSSAGINVVGGEYAWLNANTLEMLAHSRYAEQGRRCYYTSLGYAESSAQAAWDRIGYLTPPYIIAVDYGNPGNPLPPDLAAAAGRRDPFNRVNRPILERVRESPRYEIVPGSRSSGLVIFRRVAEH